MPSTERLFCHIALYFASSDIMSHFWKFDRASRRIVSDHICVIEFDRGCVPISLIYHRRLPKLPTPHCVARVPIRLNFNHAGMSTIRTFPGCNTSRPPGLVNLHFPGGSVPCHNKLHITWALALRLTLRPFYLHGSSPAERTAALTCSKPQGFPLR